MAYEIDRLLASGGMAHVYRAYDTQLGRWVALKFLRESDPELLAGMLHEARSQARVGHANVCPVFDVAEVDGQPCIVMQLLEGRGLDEAAVDMSLKEKIQVLRAVADAVQAAHSQGLIHRDLKPSNVIVETHEDGSLHPYVVDFGIAMEQDAPGLTATGTVKGTPSYMAPEQAGGERKDLDRRLDIYSLGAILFELLAGRPPFVGKSQIEVLVKLVQEEVPPLRKLEPSVPPDLETIAAKCLEKDPSRRYPSARLLAEDLDRFLAGEPVLARRPSLTYRLRKRISRNRALAWVSLGAILLTVISLGLAVRSRLRAAATAELAQAFGQEVGEVEWRMRVAYMSPSHDVRPEKQRVRERMGRIEASMREMGAVAEGPGSYALGSAHLALGEWESARRHLDRAWAAEYRAPSVSLALGKVYGRLYELALDRAERVGAGPLHDTLVDRAQRELRDPALRFLRLGERARPETRREASKADEGAYVEGLIAFYEGRHEEALQHGERVLATLGWLYEAVALRGEVQMEVGTTALAEGDAAAARVAFEGATEAYRKAAEIAASDPLNSAGVCRSLFLQIEIDRLEGQVSQSRIDEGVDACDRAIAVDPESDVGHRPRALLANAVAELENDRGGDPRPWVEAAIRSASVAVEIAGDDSVLLSTLGSAAMVRARWESNHGGNAQPWFEQSAEAHRRALELWPEYVFSRRALASSLIEQAHHESTRGRGAAALLREAVTHLAAVLEQNPDSASTLNSLGNAYWSLAEHERAMGEDPRETAELALRAFSRADRIVPAPVFSYGIGSVQLFLAEVELEAGRDAGPALEGASRALELEEPPPFFDPAIAWLGLTRGRHEVALGLSPEATFGRALRELETASEGRNDDPELERLRAEILRQLARWRVDNHRAVGDAVDEGLSAANRALELHPELVEALLTRAGLLLLESRTTRDPARSAESQESARDDLEAARRINPRIRGEWEELYRQAVG